MSRRTHLPVPVRRLLGGAGALVGWVICLCATAPAALGGAANSPAPDPSELGLLMVQLAHTQHAEARFQESQYLATLTRPLQSTGTLRYDAPEHLEQHIDTPRQQQLVLDHGQLTLQMGRRRRSVQLADYPQLAPLLDSLQAMLAGDLPGLQRNFTLQFSGALTQWSLRLTPRDPAVSRSLHEIRMQGQGAQILEVQIEQTDGDHAIMHIEPIT